MKKGKKIAVGLLIFFCAGFVFLCASIFIIPRLINHPAVGDKIRFEVSRIIGGGFDFERVELSLFPTPYVAFESPKIHLPQHGTASVQLVELFPDILPLFLGKISLDKALLKQPQLAVQVPKSTPGNAKPANSVGINRLLPILDDALAKLSRLTIPIENGTINGGRIDLVDDGNVVFALHNLDAELLTVSNKLELGLTAASSHADNVSVSLSANTNQRKGNAHLELKNVPLGKVANALLPKKTFDIQDGVSDIRVDFTMDDIETISMGFGFSLPHVRVVQAGQTADITTRGLTGNLLVEKKAVTLTVSKCILESPSMQLSGSIGISQKEPAFRLQLEGRDIDIEGTRETAIAMAGTNKVVHTLFDIIHAGSFPLITVTDQGGAPGDIGDWDHLVVQGKIVNGDISIPGANLEMTDVEGKIMLSQGILTAKDIQSIVDNSSVHNGMFKLDLKKDPLPLSVEAGMNVDLADLPTILRQFIDDKEVEKELDLVQELQGSAKGKLRLDGDTDNLKVDVSAFDVQLAGRHHNIPYPLTITDGTITYDGSRVSWGQLNGSLGQSTFTSFSGGLDLEKANTLTISSGTSDIFLSELLAWLSSIESMKGISQYYGGGTGILQLSAIKSSGPLQDFRKWNFNIAGVLKDLLIQNLPERPGLLEISSLKFTADPQTLRYSDGRLSMLDGSWTVSGKHKEYLTGIDKDISLTFAGRMGPQATSWFSKVFHTPALLKLRPLTFATSHLNYANTKDLTLSATLTVQDDLKLFTDMRIGSDELVVEKLTIHDQASQAMLSGKYKDQILDVSYDGKIHQSTLDQLLLVNPHLSGSLEGKTKVRLSFKHPYSLSLDGELNGHDLYVPLMGQPPLKINDFAVHGDHGMIRLESADLSWNEMQVTLSGDLEPKTSQSLYIDLDVEADSIDVEQLMKAMPGKSIAQEHPSTNTPLTVPLQGNIHFNAEQIKTAKFTIQPLHAEVTLQGDTADITLTEADLCGISMPGTIKLSPSNLQFHIEPEARDQQVNATLNCFANQTFSADGIFDLKGNIDGSGRAKDLLKTSTGQFDLSIADGHIYHDLILLNVIKFLNVTRVLADQVTEKQMTEKGLGFTRFQVQTKLKGGKLLHEELLFDGNDMTITGTGEIDILQEQIDFTLLVAPQKSVDTVLGWIPLIGDIFQTVVTIPLSVKGSFDDVQVFPLSPSAIGHELQEIMKKTLGVPMKLFQVEESGKPLDGDGK